MIIDPRAVLWAVAALCIGGSTAVAAQEAGRSASPQAGDRVAIVVFTNIAGAPEDDWIGHGIAETVSADLERIRGLSIVGFAALAIDESTMLDTGRRLDADWVIGGAYQRVGDGIRITARLVHIETAAVVSDGQGGRRHGRSVHVAGSPGGRAHTRTGGRIASG